MTVTMKRVVVVGNGVAGLTACDALRERGFIGELVVVGAEPVAAYSRPALSKALLAPGGDLSAHELPASSHGARELLGVSATGLDPEARHVELSDGSVLPYDGLVIATGSRARRLSGHPRELTLRDLDDARAVRDVLGGGPRVVIVGGGVLGMEVASGALAAGGNVTLVAKDAPLLHQLGAHLSSRITADAQALGLHVEVVGGAQIEDRDGSAVVVADDRREFTGAVLITAVGDVPNVEWLAGSGLLEDGRLRTDDSGRVRDGIVAAGDVATWSGADRTPLWTSAIEQAKAAAAALLDPEAPPLHFQPYFWTEMFNHNIKALGPLPVEGDPEVLDGDADSGPALLRWTRLDGTRTVISRDFRIPIPKLRRLTRPDEG